VSDLEGAKGAQIDRAQAYVSGVSTSLASSGVSIETLCPYGDPADQILKVVDQFDADKIVMSTHGRTGLSRTIYGSVTGTVARTATVSVLVVRPAKAPHAPTANAEAPGIAAVF
jgi:nucleotide-binding universal stress UspA family protein